MWHHLSSGTPALLLAHRLEYLPLLCPVALLGAVSSLFPWHLLPPKLRNARYAKSAGSSTLPLRLTRLPPRIKAHQNTHPQLLLDHSPLDLCSSKTWDNNSEVGLINCLSLSPKLYLQSLCHSAVYFLTPGPSIWQKINRYTLQFHMSRKWDSQWHGVL